MTRIGGPSHKPLPTIRTEAPKVKAEVKTPTPEKSSSKPTDTFEVKTKRSFLRNEATLISTHTDKSTVGESSTTLINGKLRQTSSSVTTTEGNRTTLLDVDSNYGRDGKLSSEQITRKLTTRYGDHASISRTNIQEGDYSSQTFDFKKTTGATSRTTTVTQEQGPTTKYSGKAPKYKKGKFNNSGPYANWKFLKGRVNTEAKLDYTNKKTTSKKTTISHDTRAETRGTSEEQATRKTNRDERTAKAKKNQGRLNIAADLGLRKTVLGGNKTKAQTLYGNDPNKTVSDDGKTTTETLLGPRVSTKNYGEVAVGADGITARGNVDIRAGLYAQGKVTHTGDFGKLQGSAGTKLEAYAEANGTAALNLNGLEARGGVKVGVEASAEVSGSYKTPPITIGGRELTAGVSAKGRVAAEAEASATGRVQFTGNPPTAIIEGQAGASAVVKAEGEVKADAGPFSVTASGYVSAGAEAQANGSVGYDDGKITLSFGAGAAVGVGAGGRVQVQVDVKQIGDAVTGLAKEGAEAAGRAMDVTGDDKFDMKDVQVIGNAAADAVSDGAEAIGNAVADGAQIVGGAVADGAKTIGNAVASGAEAAADAVSDGAHAVGSAISSGASSVKKFFSGW